MILWDERVPVWMAPRIPGCERGWDNCRGFWSLGKTGAPIGAVLFHDWSPERGTIEATVVGERGWITRRVISEALAYGFSHSRLIAFRTAESNKDARRAATGIGAVETIVPEMWGPGEGAVFATLTIEQARAKLPGIV